ncbi:MAG TPA: helix-turn-helix transcriptional regulator [Thermoanaerobaculia bacterium]
MSKKSFSALFEAAERHDEYWTERAIIEFTEALSRWMEEREISQAELAATLGVSPPYISKVMKGNVNFTLATMTKLARALGAEVHVALAPIGSRDGIARDLEPNAASF